MSTLHHIPPERELRFLPTPPPLADQSLPWALEIGPGKGEFLFNLAENNPKKNFVAVELKRGRFGKIGAKILQKQLANAFIIQGDARECLPRIFKKDFFEAIYILFPDPWPKKRHAKHRLLKVGLIQHLREFLKPGGAIYNATDQGFYSEEIVQAFNEAGGFRCEAIASLYPTYFEKKWKDLGRKIDYWKFTHRET